MSATIGTDRDLLEEVSRGCAKCVAVRHPEFHLLREPRPMTECVALFSHVQAPLRWSSSVEAMSGTVK